MHIHPLAEHYPKPLPYRQRKINNMQDREPTGRTSAGAAHPFIHQRPSGSANKHGNNADITVYGRQPPPPARRMRASPRLRVERPDHRPSTVQTHLIFVYIPALPIQHPAQVACVPRWYVHNTAEHFALLKYICEQCSPWRHLCIAQVSLLSVSTSSDMSFSFL